MHYASKRCGFEAMSGVKNRHAWEPMDKGVLGANGLGLFVHKGFGEYCFKIRCVRAYPGGSGKSRVLANAPAAESHLLVTDEYCFATGVTVRHVR